MAGRLCFDTCLSATPGGGGVPRPGPDPGGPGLTRGTTSAPPPPSDLAGGYPASGYPTSGTPCHTWPGGYPLPPSDLAGGYPTSGTTPPPPRRSHLAGEGGREGVTPPLVTDGVLDTPRSVCLLRSRRRTFLFLIV